MQFLVYLTVLMVSISTVLLEVQWLTSPPPQPKPAVQAAANESPPPRRVEGPTAALSPVYPKPAETTSAASSSAPQSQPQQSEKEQQASSGAATGPATVAAKLEPQKPAVETTGVAARAEENKDKESGAASVVSASATTSSNRCDVRACSSAYQSFRASDCTYQPFEGPRRACEKVPTQQRTTREEGDRPERRQWNRDVTSRDGDRAVRRRVYDDPDESNADDDDGPDRISIFGVRGPRW